MDKVTMHRVLTILTEEQEEDGSALDIDAERYLAIAAGNPMTEGEVGIVLASPLARDLLVLADCYVRDVLAPTRSEIGTAVSFSNTTLAASGVGSDEPGLDVQINVLSQTPLARLVTEPGPGGAFGHLLTLTLDPRAWDGEIVDGLNVTLREEGADGRVWLSGTTDARGVLPGSWPEGDESPRDRYARLGERRLFISLD